MEQREGKRCPKQEKHLKRPFLETGEMRKYMVSMKNQREFSLDEAGSGEGE